MESFLISELLIKNLHDLFKMTPFIHRPILIPTQYSNCFLEYRLQRLHQARQHVSCFGDTAFLSKCELLCNTIFSYVQCFTSPEYLSLLTCLALSDEVDVLDCYGTLIIIQSLSAVPVGVAQFPRGTCQLLCSHRHSYLLSHNQLETFSTTLFVSFTAFVLSFPVNPICLKARIVDDTIR